MVKGVNTMNAGFAALLALFLTFFHHGQLGANIQTALQTDITVTPSVSPTDTPTVTPTDTPTDTPTPETTATPTPSITPSVTPTGTPCTPEQEPDKDDMVGLKANVHAFFGLMNAAFRHERNEARFEKKHCLKIEEKEKDNDNEDKD